MYLVNLLCMAALLHMSILCCCKLSKHSAGGTGLKAQSLLRLFSLDSSGRLAYRAIVSTKHFPVYKTLSHLVKNVLMFYWLFADDDASVPVIVTEMGTMVTLVLVLVMGAATWGEEGVTRIQGVHPELRWARDIPPLHTQHSG